MSTVRGSDAPLHQSHHRAAPPPLVTCGGTPPWAPSCTPPAPSPACPAPWPGRRWWGWQPFQSTPGTGASVWEPLVSPGPMDPDRFLRPPRWYIFLWGCGLLVYQRTQGRGEQSRSQTGAHEGRGPNQPIRLRGRQSSRRSLRTRLASGGRKCAGLAFQHQFCTEAPFFNTHTLHIFRGAVG